MDAAPNSIQWETYREGVRSQLPAFESLPQDGFALVRSYQVVLDNNETFTQYFSDEPLESYTLEARLRETLGIRPSASGSEPSQSTHDPSVSWVNVFRHGKFEEQEDGSFHCYDQGKLVKVNKNLHKNILVNRCFLPANSHLWPSYADIDKESEITLAIEADVIDELKRKIKYVDRLKRLQLSLRKRRVKLQAVRDPVKRTEVPQISDLSVSRSSSAFKAHGTRLRSSSASSGVSSGSDIPFADIRNDSNPTSLGSDGDASKHSGQRDISFATQRDKITDDKGKGVSAPALVSNKAPETIHIRSNESSQAARVNSADQTRDNTPSSQRTPGDGSAKHQMLDTRGVMEPPLKKQKTKSAGLSTNLQTMELGEELAMWKAQLNTPNKPQPPPSSAGKGGKGQKRIRNNFTSHEKEHAPAWFKSQIAAGKLPNDIEQAYAERFGVFHRFLTIKLWVDRMEGKAASTPQRSKVVVLKPTQASQPNQETSTATAPDTSFATPPPYVSPYTTDSRSPSVVPNVQWPSQMTTASQSTTASQPTPAPQSDPGPQSNPGPQSTPASQSPTASQSIPLTPLKSGLPNFH